MNKSNDEIRKQVQDAYAEKMKARTGCCGSPAEGSVAALAGYEAELDAHKDAGASSFGCGNPLAFSGVGKGETVLDLGCGAGFDLLIAAEKVGAEGRVIGIDMTDLMIEKARENIARAGANNVEARKGIIEALPVADGSVDWVISNCVINLSPEKERVFRELHRVLKPGGRFSLSDMVVEDLPGWARDLSAIDSACIAGGISEAAYVAGLQAAGHENVEVKDRVVYAAEQLASFARKASDRERFAGLEGKVQSVRFTGRKT